MSTSSSFPPVVRRGLALAALALPVSLASASAQSAAPVQPATAPSQTSSEAPPQTFAPRDLFSAASPSSVPGTLEPAYSSSAAGSYDAEGTAKTELASVESFQMPGANAFQYGQRRRYGAPRYRGGNTNADGSEKYSGYVGAGFGVPVSGTSDYLSTGYGIQAGVGRNFNKHFGVNLEFDYDHFGLTDGAIGQYLLVNTGSTDNSSYDIGGNNHIWNFSVQPQYTLYSGQSWGGYVTGGVGFYHKVTNFTIPETEESYYGYFTSNETFDHYTSNALGFDFGAGLTYKFSRFANERLYAEVRYVYVDNKNRPGVTTYEQNYTGNNFFPDNSLTTSYIPVKFGVRF